MLLYKKSKESFLSWQWANEKVSTMASLAWGRTVLVFLFERLFGFAFLRVLSTAKTVSVMCNLAVLVGFGHSGNASLKVGLIVGAINVAGSIVGGMLP